jgi:hypothetical protein
LEISKDDYRIVPDNDVYKNDGCNDSAFDPVSKGEGQHHNDGEDERQRIGHLPEEDLKDRDFLAIFEAIGAVCCKARGRLVSP